MADKAEVRPTIEGSNAQRSGDSTSVTVVGDMMNKTASDVAKTIKEMQGNAGKNTCKLPDVEIVGDGASPAKGNDSHGQGPRRADSDGAIRGDRTQSPDERAEKK